MNNPGIGTYKLPGFPPGFISYAVRLCYQFNLSHCKDAGSFTAISKMKKVVQSNHTEILWSEVKDAWCGIPTI